MEPKIKNKLGTVAGIVTFNPDLVRLRENLDAIVDQVDAVIVVDNASIDSDSIRELIQHFPGTHFQGNIENSGISKALNQVMQWSKEFGASWTIMLDQDSVCSAGMVGILMQNAAMNVGIVAPAIIDRSDRTPLAEQQRREEVNYCITSGSLNNVETWHSVGGYDEAFFIDFVDFDYCLRVREGGFRIIRDTKASLLHEIGKITRHGRFIAYHHSAFRSYHMARDMINYARKHRNSPRELKVQRRGLVATYLILVRKSMIVAMFEEDRIRRVSALLRGSLAGSIGRRYGR